MINVCDPHLPLSLRPLQTVSIFRDVRLISKFYDSVIGQLTPDQNISLQTYDLTDITHMFCKP